MMVIALDLHQIALQLLKTKQDKNQNNLVKYIEEKFLKIYSQKKVENIYSDDYTKVSSNIKKFIGVEKNEIQ